MSSPNIPGKLESIACRAAPPGYGAAQGHHRPVRRSLGLERIRNWRLAKAATTAVSDTHVVSAGTARERQH